GGGGGVRGGARAARLPRRLRRPPPHRRGAGGGELPGRHRHRVHRPADSRGTGRRTLMLSSLRHNTRFQVSAGIPLVVLAFAVVGPYLPGRGDPNALPGKLFDHPSGRLWLGSDNFGHDVLTQLMYGTRSSLIIGLVAGALATLIGVVIGTVSGFRGGLIDHLLSGITNVVLAIPAFVILVLLSNAVSNRNIVTMALVIGVVSWPWTARSCPPQP